jgi:hypothetical protein
MHRKFALHNHANFSLADSSLFSGKKTNKTSKEDKQETYLNPMAKGSIQMVGPLLASR